MVALRWHGVARPGGRSLAATGLLFLLFAHAGEAAAQTRWTLSERPELVIGSVDGPAPTLFRHVVGALAMPDGSILVADAATNEVRVFAPSGRFLTGFGGKGGGPEEFGGLHWIDLCGGEAVVAYDFARRRITKWDTDGRLLEDFNVEGTAPGRPPYSVSCGPDGTFAVVGWPEVAAYAGGVGPYRLDVPIGVLDDEGRRDRVVGTFPGPERYRYATNDGPRPLGKSTIARMGADGVYVGTADSYEILVVEPNGARRSFGRDIPAPRMTEERVRVWHDSILGSMPAERRAAARRGLREHQHPLQLPAYSDFRIDGGGFVWVQRHGVPGQRITTWDVFDPDGIFVASLPVPGHFRPTDIGDDYLLGVSTDTLGVERIHRYGLSRR